MRQLHLLEQSTEAAVGGPGLLGYFRKKAVSQQHDAAAHLLYHRGHATTIGQTRTGGPSFAAPCAPPVCHGLKVGRKTRPAQSPWRSLALLVSAAHALVPVLSRCINRHNRKVF